MTTPTAKPVNLSARIASCREQQATWACLSIEERLRPVRSLRRLLVAHADQLCSAVAQDLGKTGAETVAGDILPLADACGFLEQEAGRLLRPRRVPLRHRPLWLWGQSDTVHRRPRGIVGIIGTWNYPLFINGVPLVQALVAGNGVLWKPSEVSPVSAVALHDLIVRASFPEALVQRIEATREAGKELAGASIDHVAFVGSSTTGRVLAANLGRRLVSSTLELSGCDAMFILDDADISLAARAAWFGATINRGQTCIAVRRVFVPRSASAAFSAAMQQLVATARPFPLALPAQIEQADRLIREAVAGGARVLTNTRLAPVPLDERSNGATLPPKGDLARHSRNQSCPLSPVFGGEGWGEGAKPPAAQPLYTPVVVLDARSDMAICREASFAPLLAVLPYDTLEEALSMDACCTYGLAASIFTSNPARARMLATRLHAGMVTINDVVVPTAHPATPFGGRGDSGWGVTQGAEGLLEMTMPQVVSLRAGKFRPHYEMATGSTPAHAELSLALLQSRHAAALGQRCRGWLRLLRALWQLRR